MCRNHPDRAAKSIGKSRGYCVECLKKLDRRSWRLADSNLKLRKLADAYRPKGAR